MNKTAKSSRKALYLFKNYAILALILVIILFFFIEGWQSAQCVKSVNENDLKHYQGRYRLVEQKRVRNTTHVFQLENGDQVTVPCTNEYFFGENEKLNAFSELNISYSKQKFLRWGWTSACVSIESTNGETVIMSQEPVQKELKGMSILSFCIGTLCLGLLLICYFPFEWFLPLLKKKKRRK